MAQYNALPKRQIYFTINGNAVNSAGLYCPCSVRVIPPDDLATKAGDIYDRYYAHEEVVNATGMKLTQDGGWSASYDKATFLNSIRTMVTDGSWRGLVYTTATSGTSNFVPTSMRDGIESLVKQQLHLDDLYFVDVLTQLKQFLIQVETELKTSLSKSAVANLCLVKYDINAKFNTFTETQLGNSPGSMLVRGNPTYKEGLDSLNSHLYDEFFRDFAMLKDDDTIAYASRDYYHIVVKPEYKEVGDVFNLKNTTLHGLFELQNTGQDDTEDLIYQIFQGETILGAPYDYSDLARYIGAMRTDVPGTIVGMFASDNKCQLLSKMVNESGKSIVSWYQFICNKDTLGSHIEAKASSKLEYIFSPDLVQMDFKLSDEGWTLKFLNRDFTTGNRSDIIEAYAIHCKDDDDAGSDMWYVSSMDGYVRAPGGMELVDLAYEQHGETLYAIFNGDNRVYKYRHPQNLKDSRGRVMLKKEDADMAIETFLSVYLTESNCQLTNIYLDYKGVSPNRQSWEITIYGTIGGIAYRETWSENPGKVDEKFSQYNTILFGDSLFDEEQLKFQNISKNKEMYDILDVNEVDGCYYGLFKDKRVTDKELFTVFRTAVPGGVVQRMPYNIVVSSLFRSADPLYSLFVVDRVDDRLRLQEISVPDNDIYRGRCIEIQNILRDSDAVDMTGDEFKIMDVLMTEFKVNSGTSSFFVLDNKGTGFHKVLYTNNFAQASIDSVGDVDKEGTLKWSLWNALKDTLVAKHMEEMHHGEQTSYFDVVARKVNQFKDGFSVFDLVAAEFGNTQDVGVVPSSKVDDTDTMTDHRYDSVQVSTDILWTDGMVAQTDSNPGMIVAAVSNPATTYDNETEFIKSQRNPSIVGTEFYDYICDSDGNELMDLYQIPFIYRVNSNNTYDLYINVPTTRTKYINRIAGTLKGDGTTLVRADDTATRLNFQNQMMPNNLDESTTRLRVYIDRKYISVGNVELVEISGNSIPTQIYRDSANNGLYDSIALESRWTGDFEELNEPKNDINKVMLEFECYGTDSQSIHIKGKTLINHVLDDGKYKFG